MKNDSAAKVKIGDSVNYILDGEPRKGYVSGVENGRIRVIDLREPPTQDQLNSWMEASKSKEFSFIPGILLSVEDSRQIELVSHKRVIGYQVMNSDGCHWNDRPSFEILTEETASKDFDEALLSGMPHWYMIAIREGDIEEPTFEDE